MRKQLINWHPIWVAMGWDTDVLERMMNGEPVGSTYARRDILQFILKATVDELAELVEHLKGLNNHSFKGLITRLETIIEMQTSKKPSVSLPAAEGSRYNR